MQGDGAGPRKHRHRRWSPAFLGAHGDKLGQKSSFEGYCWLQARDSTLSQEAATGGRLSGQYSMNTASPSPARDILDHSVLGFC